MSDADSTILQNSKCSVNPSVNLLLFTLKNHSILQHSERVETQISEFPLWWKVMGWSSKLVCWLAVGGLSEEQIWASSQRQSSEATLKRRTYTSAADTQICNVTASCRVVLTCDCLHYNRTFTVGHVRLHLRFAALFSWSSLLPLIFSITCLTTTACATSWLSLSVAFTKRITYSSGPT